MCEWIILCSSNNTLYVHILGTQGWVKCLSIVTSKFCLNTSVVILAIFLQFYYINDQDSSMMEEKFSLKMRCRYPWTSPPIPPLSEWRWRWWSIRVSIKFRTLKGGDLNFLLPNQSLLVYIWKYMGLVDECEQHKTASPTVAVLLYKCLAR